MLEQVHDALWIAEGENVSFYGALKYSRCATSAGYRENCAEEANNYPFQHILQNKPPYGKDRQRYPLNLTAFRFQLACISKKTVRNTVNLSVTNGSNLFDVFHYSLCISISYSVSPRDLIMHLASVAAFLSY